MVQTRRQAAAADAPKPDMEAVCARLRALPDCSNHPPVSAKRASVLVALFPSEDGPRVWLTQRSAKMRAHGGEVRRAASHLAAF